MRYGFKDESGQAMIEFAIVVSLLLMLLLGSMELGRVFHAHLVASHATREGVRLAAVGGSDSMIYEAVRDASSSLDNDLMEIRITPPESMRVRGDRVAVEIEYKLRLIIPLIDPLIPDPFPVRARSVMRVE
jgi:Flp pilus assembly protein TadG